MVRDDLFSAKPVSTTFNIRMKTIKQIYSYLFLVLVLLAAHSSRAHFGSRGPFGGTVTCAISQDSLVYIGTLNGGVFESTNNALVAWRARPVGLTSGNITALAHSGSYLFAGTADHGVFIFNGFVGSDRYWNKVNNGLGNLKVRSLLALDSVTLLAGTEGNGLYKTTDKGASWSNVMSSGVIIGLVKAGSRIFMLSQSAGVYVSNDNGNTWSDFNDVSTLNIGSSDKIAYNSASDALLVSNANGLFLHADASTAALASYTAVQAGLPARTTIRGISSTTSGWYLATDQGVYTSPLATVSWNAANNGLPATDVTAIVAAQNRLIAGVSGLGLFRAVAGTHSWSVLNTNFNNPVTRAMTAGGDSLVVSVTDDGVFVSTDLAATYHRANNGLTDSLHVNDIIAADTCLLAATENGGVFVSADIGKNWTTINTGLSNLHVKKLFFTTHHKYAIDASGNVYESALHSTTWNAIQGGLPSGVRPTSMAFYGGKLILGTRGHGVYIRDHDGDWTAHNTGLTSLDVTSVTASGNHIFAGTDGAGVFVSGFRNISWTVTAATTIPHTTMLGLDGTRIQAMGSHAGYVYASYKGGLLATADNGATWIAGGNQFNLPSFTDVNTICFVRSRVFVSTENNAVYSNALSELPALPDMLIVSHDALEFEATPHEAVVISVTGNRSWTVAADQPWITLSTASGWGNGDLVIAVSVNPGGPRTGTITLTAGSVVRTIAVEQDGSTGLEEHAQSVLPVRIYPNPSGGTIMIDLSEAGTGSEKASVYDLAGKKLAEVQLDKRSLSASFTLDLPAGVYLLQLDTGKGVISRRLVLQ